MRAKRFSAFIFHIPLAPSIVPGTQKVFNKCICWINEQKMKIPPRTQRGSLSSHTSEFLHSRAETLGLTNGDRRVALHVVHLNIHPLSLTPALKNQHLVLLVATYIHPFLSGKIWYVYIHWIMGFLTRSVIMKGVFKAMKIKDIMVMKLLKHFH